MAADGSQILGWSDITDILSTPEFAQVRNAELARVRHQDRGVRWSGMSDETRQARPVGALMEEAGERIARREDFRASYVGKARKAIADGCKAAERLHARLHDAGSALSRGDGSAPSKAEDAAETMRELRQLVTDLESYARLIQAEAA